MRTKLDSIVCWSKDKNGNGPYINNGRMGLDEEKHLSSLKDEHTLYIGVIFDRAVAGV